MIKWFEKLMTVVCYLKETPPHRQLRQRPLDLLTSPRASACLPPHVSTP